MKNKRDVDEILRSPFILGHPLVPEIVGTLCELLLLAEKHRCILASPLSLHVFFSLPDLVDVYIFSLPVVFIFRFFPFLTIRIQSFSVLSSQIQ
jgi:hypothetical protein